MKPTFTYILVATLFLATTHQASADSPLESHVTITNLGDHTSQYSPFTMSFPGWNSTRTYYCKNTIENGVARDRVWRAEIINDQIINNQIVIDSNINQSDDLACSPGVVIDQNNVWHMYYIAADRNQDMTLYLHHATLS